MKLTVINFSGNVGKSTVARHLLAPRIPGCPSKQSPNRSGCRTWNSIPVGLLSRQTPSCVTKTLFRPKHEALGAGRCRS